jgi:hypothetical protein
MHKQNMGLWGYILGCPEGKWKGCKGPKTCDWFFNGRCFYNEPESLAKAKKLAEKKKLSGRT